MRSDIVKKGVSRAPHRSLFKAIGLTDDEINKPLIGVVTSQNDIIPGHINLDKIVEAVKKGILLSGGTPLVFPTIGCLLYTSPSPRDTKLSRMPSSA